MGKGRRFVSDNREGARGRYRAGGSIHRKRIETLTALAQAASTMAMPATAARARSAVEVMCMVGLVWKVVVVYTAVAEYVVSVE